MASRLGVLQSHLRGTCDLVEPCHAADDLESTSLKEYNIKSWVPGLKPMENPMVKLFPHMRFHEPTEAVQTNIILNNSMERHSATRPTKGPGWGEVLRAGPTRQIMWDPREVKAAIVTCGGLCPGLNSIIRDITMGLYSNYMLKTPGSILGIRWGYNGFDVDKYPPIVLTPGVVEEIHKKGGSILGAGRGGFNPDNIVDTIERLGINHLYIVGGDGTQWAADVVFQVVVERKLKVSVIGVPKTIDNDILYFDKSFGFHSAVDAATEAIHAAFTEASSCHNGVGVVKLMGRDSGFVARNAVLASNVCDCCLIPEVEFEFDGPDGLIAHILRRLTRRGHAVVVVAEGAGQNHCATGLKDSTGHTVYGDIGKIICKRLNQALQEAGNGGRCFFIDPAYMIRSIPATPNDNIYCNRMAHEAVHAAMRGYSGVCVGSVHDYMVMIPMAMVASGRRRVNVHSTIWQRVVESCGMPSSLTGHEHPVKETDKKARGSPAMFRKKK